MSKVRLDLLFALSACSVYAHEIASVVGQCGSVRLFTAYAAANAAAHTRRYYYGQATYYTGEPRSDACI